jgi:hypothetical protein
MHKLSRAEMIELVERLMRGEGADEEVGEWVEALRRSAPHPAITDLIFYPAEGEENLTAEQIVDRAFAYRPIEL